MELKLGIMKAKELAEWFGISPKSYLNSRKKKLEELSMFANFDEIYGGVIIREIKIPIYAKKGARAYDIIKDNFFEAWHKSGYDTAARVGTQIWRQSEELCSLIAESTAKTYAAKVRVEFFGKVYDTQDYGSIGTCEYSYVVSNDWDEAKLLTEEEQQIIKKIKQEIYTNDQEPLLYEALRNKEITEEQYEEAISNWNSKESREDRYERFILAINEALDNFPVKVTHIKEYEKSAYSEDLK